MDSKELISTPVSRFNEPKERTSSINLITGSLSVDHDPIRDSLLLAET